MNPAVLSLIIISVISLAVGFLAKRKCPDYCEFFLSSKDVSTFKTAISLAVTWAWGPALFISAQQAYVNGLVGFLWFFVPNILTIIVFSFIAWRVPAEHPDCDTFPQVIDKLYGKHTKRLYDVQFYGLMMAGLVVQIVAGGTLVAWLTGIPFIACALFMMVIAAAYTIVGGYRSSIYTDIVQAIAIYVAILAIGLVILIPNAAAIIAGLGGIKNASLSVFSGHGKAVALSFGIVTAIGLMAGSFGDQSFWQRLTSLKCKSKSNVKKTFGLAAILFGIIPIGFGLLGFLAAGIRFVPKNVQNVNIEVLNHLEAGPVLMVLAIIALLAGVFSTLDSHLNALILMASNKGKSLSVHKSRIFIVLCSVAAFLLAIIPGMTILYLFLFYGTLRATTFIPTVITIRMQKKPAPNDMRNGILLSMIVGIPIYVYAALSKIAPLALLGSVLCVGLSGAYVYIKTKIRGIGA